MKLNLFATKDYENETAFSLRENKPNQTQPVVSLSNLFSKAKKMLLHLTINGRRESFGYFEDELEAAKAYDKAAKKYHGEFASLNFKECDS